MRKYFDVICCGDEIGSLNTDPKILNNVLKHFNFEKIDAVYVGDMDIDMETAKRARIDAVFVKGGSSLLSEVKKYKDKLIVKDLSEFLQLLRE
ncbi:MAG: HAD family hydrolase [Candidatus Omnitrophica bacterium]|nr:HAD family hydrolase [Candidatus Omnitrophota bacterium]MCK5393348.1 HAD family hydrolase [Candidatus Omnitrophota bacterium]MCK5494306.1 HAD family hydrolase [Candidatus Omnitrophota bacterium]